MPLVTPQVYPAYNEVLGQFALLNKPKIDVTQYEESTSEMCVDNDCLLHGVWYQNYNKRILKLRLTDSLRYKFNPALDFDTAKTQLYGSFIITLSGVADSNNDSLIIRQYLDQNEMHVTHALNIGTERKLIVETPWLQVQKLLNRFFSMTIENSNGCVCGVYPFPFPVNVHPVQAEQLAQSIDKIEFKLMADMYFNELNFHEDQNNTTQVFTYLLYDKVNPSGSLNTVNFNYNDGSTWERPYIPGTLTISSAVNINPSSSQVIHQNADTLFINAENIIINSSVSVEAGYVAVFQGVYSVKIGPNGHINPNIILRINDFGQSQISGVSDLYLDDYRTGDIPSGYQANIPTPPAQRAMAIKSDEHNKERIRKENKESSLKLHVYPNPTSGKCHVEVHNKNAISFTLRLLDMTGKTLEFKTVNNVNDLTTFDIDLSEFSKGIFLLRITDNLNQTKMEKIIKM